MDEYTPPSPHCADEHSLPSSHPASSSMGSVSFLRIQPASIEIDMKPASMEIGMKPASMQIGGKPASRQISVRYLVDGVDGPPTPELDISREEIQKAQKASNIPKEEVQEEEMQEEEMRKGGMQNAQKAGLPRNLV